MSQKLQIGLVGFGRMGQEHARQIAKSGKMELVLIVEPGQANLNLAGKSVSASEAEIYAELEDGIQACHVDGWIVSSPTNSHVGLTRTLLEREQRVLLEKPIANNLASAEELQDLVEPNSANLMMGHILLWSPEFQKLQAQVEKHENIREISALRQRSQSHRMDYPAEPLFSLLMVHDLYCIQSLTECKEPIKIVGKTRTHEDGGENWARAVLTWSDSTVAIAESNYFLADFPLGLIDDEMSVRGQNWSERVEYRGNFERALGNELAHFAALLRGEAEVPIGARYEDAVQVQGWVDTLISSAASSIDEGE